MPSLNPTNSRNGTLPPQSRRQEVIPKSGVQTSTRTPTSQFKQLQSQSQLKKVTHRSSKPILNWFQRKLGGTVKAGRRNGVPMGGADSTIKRRDMLSSHDSEVPAPIATQVTECRSNGSKMDTMTPARRKTISLNQGDDDGPVYNNNSDDEGQSTDSSVARHSAWSPASALEADDDASVRPLPPSAPPSPSPSRSSSSYLSDPRTFRSLAASTKPTTLLSVDMAPNDVAHIAQVPTTTLTQMTRLSPHIRSSSAGSGAIVGSGASITFSALQPSSQSSRPSSLQHVNNITSSNPPTPQTPNGAVTSVQAPLHTTHHPRNNPRPSSPPMDNASVLTLASSAFAVPGSRMGVGMQGWSSVAPSAMGADSISQFGSITGEGDPDADAESTSHYMLGEYERGDVDASVRALRPRSSRRGSWDSEASGWSARVGGGALTSPSFAARSVRTSNSVRTGGQVSVENDDDEETHGSNGVPSVCGVTEDQVSNGMDAPVAPLQIETSEYLLSEPKADRRKDDLVAEGSQSVDASNARSQKVLLPLGDQEQAVEDGSETLTAEGIDTQSNAT